MEMSKVVPSLFLVYDIEKTDPKIGLNTRNWWFTMQEGLVCNIRRRGL